MKKPSKKSALKEVKGVENIQRLNSVWAVRKRKQPAIDIDLYVQKIREGDKIFLSKAITLIESQNPERFKAGRNILKKLLPYTGNSVRIGITGVPGVGKSTFIENVGKHYTAEGHKVAVLAIDPSSSLSKGSILGDKTRMEQLAKDSNAYVRPTASGKQLGGVARKTRESILLCEAAGYDRIIVETVGVGQSETMVAQMVDFFLLLKLAGAGDELQGIKRGIMEMADLIVIHKADGENLHAAKMAQRAFQTALHYFQPKENGWNPEVILASSITGKGIDKVKNIIDKFTTINKKNNFLKKNRQSQELFWLHETIKQTIFKDFQENKRIIEYFPKVIKKMEKKELDVFEAAEFLLNLQK